MSKKLLHKTQRAYLIYSTITLIIVAPLFFFITTRLYIHDIDEKLMLRKSEFFRNRAPNLKKTDIPFINKFNNDIKIEESKALNRDTIFNSYYFNSLEKENEPFRELNSPLFVEGEPYTFVAKVNLIESGDLLASIAIIFSTILILLLFGLFLITKKISFSVWDSFYDILNQIEHFEIDKNELPQFPETDIEEFNRLNQSLKELAEKNIAIFQNQREFIENAAHELQTPLAVFQAKIDTFIQSPDISRDQSIILSSLNESVSRLNRLNKNLLILSKIDKQQSEEKVSFSLKELIKKQLDFFMEQAKQKNLNIKYDLENDIRLEANPGLTEILINNLFLNAIQHNIPNGKIQILISEQKLIVTNTGELQSLHQEKLFNRFTKNKPSDKGNGLGLAIVKKIVELNSWKVFYNYSNNLHFFSVQF